MDDEESSEMYGYVASLEPVVGKHTVSYRIRIVSPGSRSWTIFMRNIPRKFKLGVFAKIRVLVSRQTKEEKLIAEDIEVLENPKPCEFVESIIEEVSKGPVTIISGWRENNFFSLPVEDIEVLKKLTGELPVKAMCLFIESKRGLSLASIMSSKEWRIIKRTLELVEMIEEYEEESDKKLREELSEVIYKINLEH